MSDNMFIKVEGLKKHYNGDEVKALDGVDCEIKKGEVVVIIGPSGSGKSFPQYDSIEKYDLCSYDYSEKVKRGSRNKGS